MNQMDHGSRTDNHTEEMIMYRAIKVKHMQENGHVDRTRRRDRIETGPGDNMNESEK